MRRLLSILRSWFVASLALLVISQQTRKVVIGAVVAVSLAGGWFVTYQTTRPKSEVIIYCPCGMSCALGWCWCHSCYVPPKK